MHIIVILALVIVAWAAVEWMFFKEVARTWRASDRLKWKAILIYFATYWPLAFWIELLKVVEETANATGHCCFDF